MTVTLPRLIGMVHLAALPGSPGFSGDLDAVISAAVSDATTLAEAGFDAIGVENFGDVPFFPDDVPKVTVTTMTAAVHAIRTATPLPLMVNVLRNDGLGALAVAAATGAEMIRVNVLSGSMWTDQGIIQGRAAQIARLRGEIAPATSVLADVFVKHATPPPGTDLVQATLDLAERGGADAVVVSGAGTGAPADLDLLRMVRTTVPDTPVYVGSGTNADTVRRLLQIADGIIVGTAIKVDGVTTNPVDATRSAAIVAAARD